MNRLLLICFIPMLFSCASTVKQPSVSSPTLEQFNHSNQTSAYTIHIRPFVARKPGSDIYWNQERWEPQFDFAKKVYKRVGINLVFLDPKFEDGTYFDLITSQSWSDLKGKCEEHLFSKRELPVWFVGSIYVPSIGMVSGLSSSPKQIFGSTCGAAISYYSSEITLAHEIGHQFGLLHPWEYLFKEKVCGKYECFDPECIFNVMGYCNEAANEENLKYTLDNSQIENIYKTINSYPKNLLLRD